jgi:hypothetical protein
LCGTHGELEAARVVARLLGAVCEHGEDRVRLALEAAINQHRSAVPDLAQIQDRERRDSMRSPPTWSKPDARPIMIIRCSPTEPSMSNAACEAVIHEYCRELKLAAVAPIIRGYAGAPAMATDPTRICSANCSKPRSPIGIKHRAPAAARGALSRYQDGR